MLLTFCFCDNRKLQLQKQPVFAIFEAAKKQNILERMYLYYEEMHHQEGVMRSAFGLANRKRVRYLPCFLRNS